MYQKLLWRKALVVNFCLKLLCFETIQFRKARFLQVSDSDQTCRAKFVYDDQVVTLPCLCKSILSCLVLTLHTYIYTCVCSALCMYVVWALLNQEKSFVVCHIWIIGIAFSILLAWLGQMDCCKWLLHMFLQDPVKTVSLVCCPGVNNKLNYNYYMSQIVHR